MYNFLSSFIYETGFKASEVKKAYVQAYNECKHLAKENDLDYIKETMEVILDIGDRKTCAERFMKSGYTSFEKFVEELIDEDIQLTQEDVLSTGFAIGTIPEVGPEAQPITIGLDGEDENKKNERDRDII